MARQNRVAFRGRPVLVGWPEKLKRAQTETVYTIGGRNYPRVPYGSEGPPWDADTPCHDCSAIRGELHVPGCDVERCPACGGQTIGCDCEEEPGSCELKGE